MLPQHGRHRDRRNTRRRDPKRFYNPSLLLWHFAPLQPWMGMHCLAQSARSKYLRKSEYDIQKVPSPWPPLGLNLSLCCATGHWLQASEPSAHLPLKKVAPRPLRTRSIRSVFPCTGTSRAQTSE
mmetsp:Transcript_94193/g.261659  ORF Transcript_94193/g.261659 Transcript_94193/m.261659 type:complete len:125 (-) Transcript_94193:440-814(-)